MTRRRPRSTVAGGAFVSSSKNNKKNEDPTTTMMMTDQSIRVLHSCPDEDAASLRVVQALDAKLMAHKQRFQELAQAGDASVRRIQGSRFEVFVSSTYKPSTAFDEVCDLLASDYAATESTTTTATASLSAHEIKQSLLQFAEKQAGKDVRFPSNKYSYNNFSLLITYDAVDAQGPHIDLLFPNAQFGLLLTDKSPGTITYPVVHSIQSARDLPKYVAAWRNAPAELLHAMQDFETGIPTMMENFGNTLYTCPKATKTPLLFCGDCSSLPGSVLHAGPSCHKFRAILFFSAWPKAMATEIAEYNPDTQYFGALLLADMVPALWPRLTRVQDKEFLLERLAEYTSLARQQHHIHNVYAHVDASHFAHDFMQAIEYRFYAKEGLSKEEYIQKEARTRRIVLLPPVVQGETVSLDLLRKISVAKLATDDDDGIKCQISVYKDLRSGQGDTDDAAIPTTVSATVVSPGSETDDATARVITGVLIHYHADGAWEGCDGGYTLEMRADAGAEDLFDGSNGMLKDADGEIIPCSLCAVKRQRVK